MRAWLLLLAVLATFQTNVQVASTEDISTTFVTAITKQQQQTLQPIAIATATENPAATNSYPVQNYNKNNNNKNSYNNKNSNNSFKKDIRTTHFYENSLSEKTSELLQQQQNQKHQQQQVSEESDIIIEIKNFEEFETIPTNIQRQQKQKQQQQLNLDNKVQENISEIDQLETNSQTSQLTAAPTATINTKLNLANSKNNNLKNNQNNNLSEFNSNAMAVISNENTHSTTTTTTSRRTTTISTPPSSSPPSPASSSSSSPAAKHDKSLANAISKSHPDGVSNLPSPTNLVNDDNDENDNDNESDNVDVDVDVDSDSDADNEQPTFSDRELLIEKVQPDPTTLVEIENSLLSLFNMKRPPTIDRSKIIIPDAMKALYAQMMGQEIDSVNIPKPGLLTKSANTVRSFTHKDSKIDDRFPHHHRFRLYFDIKTIPAEEKLKAAELQLSRDAISHAALNPRLANRTRYQVLVYDITRVGVRGKREPSYLLLDNKTIRLNSTETVSLDVQPAVDRWLASPNRNYGLLIEVRTMRTLKPAPHRHVRLRRSADEPHESWQHKQPLLFTYTDDGRHKSRSIRDVSNRSKRAGRRPNRRKNTEEICHRKSLYVDFSDVGWANWIVAPPGYDAYYCHGKCPFPLADHLNSTNHAVVQTLVNNINPEKVPKACCVPTQLEGISMLYLNDQNTVVLKNYQDMTVVGCGCR